MSLDPQAAALNDVIRNANPAVERMLSARGKGIFFPKLGVLSQSAEAAGKDINATAGIALEDDGGPVALPSIAKSISLPPAEAFPYSPSPGRPDIRRMWREMMRKSTAKWRDYGFELDWEELGFEGERNDVATYLEGLGWQSAGTPMRQLLADHGLPAFAQTHDSVSMADTVYYSAVLSK